MAKVSAADVKKLRETTGSGMMDCKKALEEADGDFDRAIEVLRKKGQKVAAKRADRASSEGVVLAKSNADSTKGIILSLNCETDFVAKNDDFIQLAGDIAQLALNYNTKAEVLAADFDDELSVEKKLTEQTGVIGEKIEIGAFEVLEAAFVGSYIHAGNTLAAIVGLSKNTDGASQIAKDVAMQAAAMNPIALNEVGVAQETVEKEKDIIEDQLKKEGKPEKLWDQISKGKLQRFYKDSTLVNQVYIKDNKIDVAGHVKSELGDDVEVTGFKRVSISG